MADYTYDELRQMQEKALERVQRMQQRARQYVDDSPPAPPAPKPRQPAAPQLPEKPKPGRIKMPLNLPEDRDLVYPSFREVFSAQTQQAKAQSAQKTKANLLDEVLKEPDEAMLFSLLLLLRAEGADEALLLALLYIMR
ncbi:MAG TPA: hypothetical protein IAC53_04175 [Candidatus Fimenecus excrementigallinarum]|uniref:Uncharacterized protein n=1 Tax=Candidatus Fimenecus excrementigallinarum TaxID=2840816 RepID=A0A9D1IH97_9FIRM|nr:hypothetical protein [Candidatus Fimenecus excrementigallinarum]